MPKVKVNDLDMYYEIQGKGYPMVMIMGLSANIDWWGPDFLAAVSKNFKIIIFDNRGAGRTNDPGVDFSVKTMADDTLGLMKALKVQKSHVLGVSMGGMIAQELVLNYPQNVEKLVLCSTNAGGSKQVTPSAEVMALLSRDRAGMTEEEIARDTIPLLFTKEFINENPDYIENVMQQFLKAPIKPDSYQRQIKAILQFNAGRRLKKVNTPTLVVHGKKDILVPTKNGEILSELISGAKLALFDNSGHAIFSQETEKVAKTIIDFLK